MAQAKSSLAVESSHDTVAPPSALQFVLPYLNWKELLAVQQVWVPGTACQACRSLRTWVEQDGSLWRHLALEPPLSQQLTEEALETAVKRGGGLVESISIANSKSTRCLALSTDTLKRVLANAPKLQRLHIPGCLEVNASALLSLVKSHADVALREGRAPTLRELRFDQTSNINSLTPVHFLETLRLLEASSSLPPPLASEKFKISTWHKMRAGVADIEFGKGFRRPRLLHEKMRLSSVSDWLNDCGGSTDLELCPLCAKVDFVFDCAVTSWEGEIHSNSRGAARDENRIQGMAQSCAPVSCRACLRCIPRCVECGRCLPPQVGSSEAICCCHVCDKCEVALPQCTRCEHRSCWSHLEEQSYLESSKKWFVCRMCVIVDGDMGEGEDWGCL